MADYKAGIKRDVAELKFLIHDLRVEKFINEVIHFHVTLNTDLEIHDIEQARILHGEDLQVLKSKTVALRKAFHAYSNAVRSFSPDKTILLLGWRYIESLLEVCLLIDNPLWGRSHPVLEFLPEDARAVRAYPHYRNDIHWIRGVRKRIEDFQLERRARDGEEAAGGARPARTRFDAGAEIDRFTRDVVAGYVAEHSQGRVKIELGELDSAFLEGSEPRFRRMFFNLVMNAVDAMHGRPDGRLEIWARVEAERLVVRVRDNGSGMSRAKIDQLLADRHTLDGELHSLGFVFVRQTIDDFGGQLSIDSEQGVGTTVGVALPCLPGDGPAVQRPPVPVPPPDDRMARPPALEAAVAKAPPPRPAGAGAPTPYGRLVLGDYESSEAVFPGSIFGIAIDERGSVEFFSHRPYDRYFEITHEDLSPMLYEALVRGRIDEDEEKTPVLTLKDPITVGEYFDLREIPASERSAGRFAAMVREELVRIARLLVATGMPETLGVLVANLERYFHGEHGMDAAGVFPIGHLAAQPLRGEQEAPPT